MELRQADKKISLYFDNTNIRKMVLDSWNLIPDSSFH